LAVNRLLAPFERVFAHDLDGPVHPCLFIVGCPRTGSTVLSQLLATTGRLGYVSNFIARFWMAPGLGARLANGLGVARLGQSSLSSFGGRTEGWAEPHEFGYFWDRWFTFRGTCQVAKKDLAIIDRDAFRRSIASLETAHDRPLFFKNQNKYSFQIDFLAETLPTSRFVFLKRDPCFQVESVLKMRKRIRGDIGLWWTMRPPNVETLIALPPIEQVVAQTQTINSAIAASLCKIPKTRWLVMNYEDLCDQTVLQVKRCLELVGVCCNSNAIPERLTSTNRQTMDSAQWTEIGRLCVRYGLV